LGGIFDANLTFDPHVQITVNTYIFFSSRNIARLRCVVISYVVISSHYCHQNPDKTRDHITPILESLHCMAPCQISCWFLKLSCLPTYKVVPNGTHGLAPQYLSELLIPYIPMYYLCSSDPGL